MLAVRESLLKELGTVVDDLVIEQVIRTGTADIGEKYLTVIRKAAGDYTKEIFHKLREREYNPELMRLYVVGGGGCMIQNFGEDVYKRQALEHGISLYLHIFWLPVLLRYGLCFSRVIT